MLNVIRILGTVELRITRNQLILCEFSKEGSELEGNTPNYAKSYFSTCKPKLSDSTESFPPHRQSGMMSGEQEEREIEAGGQVANITTSETIGPLGSLV